ncbi:hypothetical protein OQA88_5317 [Cercophora sp. LCS_1]
MTRSITPLGRLVRLSGLHLPDHQSVPDAAQDGEIRRPVLDDNDLRDDAPQDASCTINAQNSDQDPNFLSVQTAPFRRDGGVPPITRPTPQSEPSVITDLGNRLRMRTDSSALSCDDNPGDLQDALTHEFVESAVQRANFLPNRQLPRLINPASVEKELAVYQKSIMKRIKTLDFRLPLSKFELIAEAHKICGSGEQSWHSHFETITPTRGTRRQRPLGDKSYRKILAILILIDRPSRIHDFVEDEVCDADLPLEKFQPPGKPSSHWELRRKDGKSSLKCFSKKRKWRQSTIRKFEKTQWAVLAPYLSQDARKVALRYKIPDSAILPFASWSQITVTSGFSKVFAAEVHPDHHAFDTRTEKGELGPVDDMSSPLEVKTTRESTKARKDMLAVAVKQLRPETTEQDFLREFKILRHISKHQHEHLITLLASYEQMGLYHLVFPLATADLYTYWKTFCSNPERDPATAAWIAEQCEGLARGLEAVHKHDTFSGESLMNGVSPEAAKDKGRARSLRTFHCRHGDIKPENTLWFPDPEGKGKGTLKIADFGAAEVTEKDEVPWRKNPASLIYEPPEARIQPPDGIIKTSYDIWCLGCIFLNMAVWYFDGWEGIENFLTRRQKVGFSLHGVPFHTGEFYFADKDDDGKPVAKVKPVVHQVIQELHSHPDCTPFLHEFLTLIQEGMLIVERDGRGRKSAHNIASDISEMRERGI